MEEGKKYTSSAESSMLKCVGRSQVKKQIQQYLPVTHSLAPIQLNEK